MDSVDKHWSWVVLFAAFLANLLAGGIVFSFGILFTDFRDRLETGILETAIIGAIAFALCCFSAPLSRAMTSKLGYRFVTVAGSVIAFLGLLLGCFAPSIHYYYVFFGVLVGCGYGMVLVATFMAVEDYFQHSGPIPLTLASCGFPAGVFLLPLITRALLDTYSFFGTFMILSALMLNCGVCGLLLRPLVKNVILDRDKHTYERMSSPIENDIDAGFETPDEEKAAINTHRSPKYNTIETIIIPANETISFENCDIEYELEEDSSVDDDEVPEDKEVEKVIATEESVPVPSEPKVTAEPEAAKETKENPKTLLNVIAGVNYGRMLCHAWIILYLLASILFSMGLGIIFCFYPDASRDYGYSDTKAEWTLSLLGLGSCVGIVISGFLRQVLADSLERGATLLVCIALVLTSPCVLQVFTSYSAVLLGAFLAGLFSVAFYFLRSDVVCEHEIEDYHTSAWNVSLCICGFGYIIGIPVSAYLKENHDTYKWSFVMAAVCFGVSALCVFPLIFLRRRQSTD